MEEITINGTNLSVKMYNGQRVVTFSDIDNVHNKESETSKYRFRDNRKHFIEGVDFFTISRKNVGANFATTYGFSNKAPKGIILTESGYLMIVKSFTDDLSWEVQRKLVNSYFKLEEVLPQSNEVQALQNDLSVVFVQINNMETLIENQSELLSSVMDNMTISTRQQEKLLRAGRNRVNLLLGGAHSDNYKKVGRVYLANLWNNFKEDLHCGSSYKDLNPKDFYKALDYINSWSYQA